MLFNHRVYIVLPFESIVYLVCILSALLSSLLLESYIQSAACLFHYYSGLFSLDFNVSIKCIKSRYVLTIHVYTVCMALPIMASV